MGAYLQSVKMKLIVTAFKLKQRCFLSTGEAQQKHYNLMDSIVNAKQNELSLSFFNLCVIIDYISASNLFAQYLVNQIATFHTTITTIYQKRLKLWLPTLYLL